jgi:uncharacterized membrane protein (UPF0127 family)
MELLRVKLLIMCTLLAFACCQNERQPGPPEPPRQSKHEGLHKLLIGKTPVYVEIAMTDAARQFGLMKRKSMPEDEGMLFVYPECDWRSFWMKDTLIALSLAYLDKNGVILEILDMEPLDETSHPSSKPAQYALEVNKGWFKKHGIKAGDSVANLPSPEGADY